MNGRRARRKWLVAVEAAAVLAPIAFGAFLITAYPLGADQGMYVTVAEGMRHGRLIYRDLFDIKPPGVYYSYALALDVFGRGTWAVRWLDVIAAAVMALAAWRLAKRLVPGPWPAISAALLGFAALAAFDFWNLSQPDNFAGAPIALAYWAIVGRGDERRRLRLGAAGLLLALAFLLKYTAASAILGIWLYEGIRSKRFFYALGGAVLWTGLAFAAAVAAVLVYFAAAGILPAFWELNVDVLPRYGAAALVGGPLAQLRFVLWPTVRTLIQLVPYLIVPALVGLGVALCSRRTPEKWALALWLFTAAVGVLIQRRSYYYHWAVMLPALAVCGALGMSAIAASFRKRRFAALGVIAIVLAVAPARPYKYYFQKYWYRLAWYLGDKDAEGRFYSFFQYAEYDCVSAAAVAAYIDENAAPDDTIFVWGFDATIYFLSGRFPSGRYVGYLPAATWFPPASREKFISRFIEHPPRYFVVPRGQCVYPILGTTAGPAALLRGMPRLYEFFIRNYVETADFPPYLVYVLT